jgi:hypothetical protein
MPATSQAVAGAYFLTAHRGAFMISTPRECDIVTRASLGSSEDRFTERLQLITANKNCHHATIARDFDDGAVAFNARHELR